MNTNGQLKEDMQGTASSAKTEKVLTERELLQSLRSEFEDISTKLKEEDAERLSSQTREMIDFVQSRIQEWTEYRTSSIQIALGMFAFCVAGLALISDPSKTPWYVYPAGIPFLVALLVTSLRLFLLVSRQISFWYPFSDVAETWRWFYLYTVPSSMVFTTKLKSDQRAQSKRLFLEGLITYTKKTIELNPQSEFKQNIEQLYLLLVYEGYMDKFAMTSHELLSRGIRISISLSILVSALTILYWFSN